MSRSNSLIEANSKLRRDIAYLQTALKGTSFSPSPVENHKNQRKFPGWQRETVSKHLINRLNYSDIGYSNATLDLDTSGFQAMRKPHAMYMTKPQNRNASILSGTISSVSRSTRELDDSSKSHEVYVNKAKYSRDRKVSFDIEPNPFVIQDSAYSLPQKTVITTAFDTPGTSMRDRTLADSFDHYYGSEEENVDRFIKAPQSLADYNFAHEQRTRLREETLLKEIDSLRKDNLQLKALLTKPKLKKAREESKDTGNRREAVDKKVAKGKAEAKFTTIRRSISRGLAKNRDQEVKRLR